MLLDDLRSTSKSLIKLWIIIFCLQAVFFIISFIVVVNLSPNHSSWIWNFITLTRGLEYNVDSHTSMFAILWLLGNGTLSALDFFFSYGVHKENVRASKRSHSNRDTFILAKMHRNLKFAMIFILVAFFMQILHGVLWWITGILSLAFKYFYYRELIHLFVEQPIFNFKSTESF